MTIDEEDIAPIKEQFTEITDLEAKIIYLRRDNNTYGNIQLWLGNPSKKWIRQVLLKWEPELIEIKTY